MNSETLSTHEQNPRCPFRKTIADIYSDVSCRSVSVLLRGRLSWYFSFNYNTHSYAWQNVVFFKKNPTAVWIRHKAREPPMAFLKEKGAKAGQCFTWQKTVLGPIPSAAMPKLALPSAPSRRPPPPRGGVKMT